MTDVPPSDSEAHPDTPPSSSRGARLVEVALLFTRLGFTAFGGPAAHVALMEDEVVRRRGWLDRRHFLDLVSALNFIPGPNSTELAIHLGWLRAGLPGLVVAGACFILPAAMIVVTLAWAYVRFGTVPQVRHVLLSVNAAVIAVLLVTFWRLARTAITDRFTLAVAILAAAGAGVAAGRSGTAAYQPELVLLGAAAVAGALWYGRPPASNLPLLALAPLLLTPGVPERALMARLFLAMLKIGATLYGSGYVLVSYLRSTAVEQHGWLTEQQLLDAVSVGQVTPGPLLTTATFAGYVIGHQHVGTTAGGVLGAAVATAGIFLPSFVLVALFGRVIDRLRANRYARGALDATNAAVAALILVVTLQLAAATLLRTDGAGGPWRPDAPLVAVTLTATFALLRWHVNPTWLIASAAAIGAARELVGSP